MMSSVMNSGVFPGMQGGPLEHVIASKAVAFGEALDNSFKAYGDQVIKNAKAMSEELTNRGYKVISGGTDNHLMLIDLRSKNITGKDAEKALVSSDITINKNMVPYDDKSPFVTSGIRLGTAAVTTRGFKEKQCLQVIDWIDTVLSDHTNSTLINETKSKINRYMMDFPLYADDSKSF